MQKEKRVTLELLLNASLEKIHTRRRGKQMKMCIAKVSNQNSLNFNFSKIEQIESEVVFLFLVVESKFRTAQAIKLKI